MQRTKQAIEILDKAQEKIDRFLKSASPRMGQRKRAKEVKSNITDNESAKMTPSKGTIQGYNGVATVDKKHQVIVDAQAFGEGQEQHALQPVLEAVDERFRRLDIRQNLFESGVMVTADTGFANEGIWNTSSTKVLMLISLITNFAVVIRNSAGKNKYGKRFPTTNRKKNASNVIPASEFHFNPDSVSGS